MTSFNYGKKFAFTIAMMACVMSLSACSSDYVISTNDGHMITTHGKPARDKETGMISYKGTDGNMHQLQQHDVKEIVQK
ncbi:YgdI/YgdR family lipoprotein [Pantoea agglomerans]|uniref:YgdI/YgdR family lipoprotein n=1 Tax=Enterobacter agglomerans TaxID=549 RepID=UPI0013C9355C|nr:YgdI/YgdR family lipoprotein [Pantoea agglomerans]NEG60706.1 YgdI/YgdR family lipoprotein [Pantoea agglomerans]NEH05081.1 YgdI/YgdR family lipoprotein [Pantoea agglomerans]